MRAHVSSFWLGQQQQGSAIKRGLLACALVQVQLHREACFSSSRAFAPPTVHVLHGMVLGQSRAPLIRQGKIKGQLAAKEAACSGIPSVSMLIVGGPPPPSTIGFRCGCEGRQKLQTHARNSTEAMTSLRSADCKAKQLIPLTENSATAVYLISLARGAQNQPAVPSPCLQQHPCC